MNTTDQIRSTVFLTDPDTSDLVDRKGYVRQVEVVGDDRSSRRQLLRAE
jgi:hypothetical protein